MRREKGSGVTVRAVGEGEVVAAGAGATLYMNGCVGHDHPDVAFNKLSIVKDASSVWQRERSERQASLQVRTHSFPYLPRTRALPTADASMRWRAPPGRCQRRLLSRLE